MRKITNLRIMPFVSENKVGTQMLYDLNGVPACSRVWWETSYEGAMMYLVNLK